MSDENIKETLYCSVCEGTPLLFAAESRGTPVLLSASVSDNSGNSPQMSAPRRSCDID